MDNPPQTSTAQPPLQQVNTVPAPLEGEDKTKVLQKRKPWYIDVGEQYMLRADCRRKAMASLHSKLHGEKSDMKLIALSEYDEESSLVRKKQVGLFSGLKRAHMEMNNKIKKYAHQHEKNRQNEIKMNNIENSDIMTEKECHKLHILDCLTAVNKKVSKS